MNKTKICIKCGVEKGISEFHKHKDYKDGYTNQCKECKKEYDKERRQKRSQEPKEVPLKKICSICKVEKNINEFNKNSNTKDGYRSDCRECQSKYYKEYYQENKDSIAEKSKEYRQENKDKIAEYKKEYRQKNKDKIAESHKKYIAKYNKTLRGIIVSFNGNSRDRFKAKDIYKDNYIQDISVEMFMDMLTFFECKCAYTGESLLEGTFSLDHCLTRSKGGYHFISNVVPTTKHINDRKKAKDYIDFILEVSSSKEEAYQRIIKIMAWQKYALEKYIHLLSDDELIRLHKAINNNMERANL